VARQDRALVDRKNNWFSV